MCTAISYTTENRHFFGRNLDLEFCYREEVSVMPRNYPIKLRSGFTLEHHYAMIGMATISGGYPLFYEATNERGLSLAGLNFPDNAVYHVKVSNKDNIAPFELIPWILGQCGSVKEALPLLRRINIWNLPFSREFPLTPLHWLLSDKEESIVLEPTADGLQLYRNPLGVLTNNPPFPWQLNRLADFMQLSAAQAKNNFSDCELLPYSNGMGAMGLPGDFSSASRFVRAAFVKDNSVCTGCEISQFMHMLSSVSMPRGSICIEDGKYEITQYACCCDTKNGVYYYTTYDNSRITAVQMAKCALYGRQIISFPLHKTQDIYFEN